MQVKKLKDLLLLRDEIDQIDNQIAALYQKRMQLSLEVAEYKIGTGKKVFDKEREQEKIKKLTALVPDGFSKNGIQELYEHIMSISRMRQYQKLTEHGVKLENDFQKVDKIEVKGRRIVFQGAKGAYAHIAMNQYFGHDTDNFSVESWREALEAVKSGSADYAVLPIENSTAGVVAENYDLLAEYELSIIGEQIISVNHCLLGLSDAEISDIAKVYSHPQALAQCDKYLQGHGTWECFQESNTAIAAEQVKKSGKKHNAAIASALTARLYGLKILDQNIQDSADNSTRFIIVAKEKIFLSDAQKMSICLELKHKSGSLYHALSHIIYNELNMTFIQSRPLTGRGAGAWQYRFFIDFEGNMTQSAVQNALRGLIEECEAVRVLGNY